MPEAVRSRSGPLEVTKNTVPRIAANWTAGLRRKSGAGNEDEK